MNTGTIASNSFAPFAATAHERKFEFMQASQARKTLIANVRIVR
jgi:hypothetical protein